MSLRLSVNVRVRMNEDTHAFVRKQAESRGVAPSTFVRMVLVQLANQRTNGGAK